MGRETIGLIIEALLDGPKDWKVLKERTKLSDGTLAKYLKKMLEKGYIEERISDKDRRKKIYRLVPSKESLEIATEKIMGIAISHVIKESFKENNSEEDIQQMVGRIFLDLLFVGSKGNRIAQTIFESVDKIKEDIDQEIQEKYKKSFEETYAFVSELLKKEIETDIGIKMDEESLKRYFVKIELDFDDQNKTQ